MSVFQAFTTIRPEQRLHMLATTASMVTGPGSMAPINAKEVRTLLTCKALYDVVVMRFLAADEKLRELQARGAVPAIVAMAQNDYDTAKTELRRAGFLGWGIKTDENGNVVSPGDGSVAPKSPG